MEKKGRLFFWAVMAGGALLLFLRLGTPPLIDPDEARFARTSLEMTRSGDLVVPTFEGAPRVVKPPLLHWLQAMLFRYVGASELSARLPAALATLASMWLVAFVARRRFGEEGGAWAAAIFISQPLVFGIGRLGSTDALLSVHILGAIALDIAEPRQTGPRKGAAIGALLGLAFLAKGPVGVVLPLLVILAGRTAAGRRLLPDWRTGLALATGWSVVALPWILAFVRRITASQALDTVRDEVWQRYFSGTAHVEPPWYFAVILLGGAFPWVAVLPLALVRVLKQRRSPEARTALYAGAGLLIGLALFSFGEGKLPQYILPLMPLVALLVTWHLGQDLELARVSAWGPTLLTAGLFLVSFALWTAANAVAYPEERLSGLVGAAAFGLGGLAGLAGLVRRRPRQVYAAALASSVVLLSVTAAVLHPTLAARRSAADLVDRVPELRSARPLVVIDIELPSLTYYADRLPERITAGALDRRLDRADAPLVVAADVDVARMPASLRARLKELGRSGKLRAFEPKHESRAKVRSPPS